MPKSNHLEKTTAIMQILEHTPFTPDSPKYALLKRDLERLSYDTVYMLKLALPEKSWREGGES